MMLFLLGACGAPKAADNSGDNPDQSSEMSYCSEVKSYPSGVMVSGRGRYQYRAVDRDSGLSASMTTDNIPYAEIRVTSSGGATVQCGTTDGNGQFSVVVPGAGTYTITILARSETAKVKVTVNADYYANKPHSISKTVTVSSSSYNAGDITALGRASQAPNLEGGAFNIYAQIYKANEFLRTKLNNTGFVAPRVKVYWRMGFNPYTYFGYSTLLSFYRPGTGELFILGGDKGYVHNVDTDHFDDSVILHEYGHFLEDVYSVSDSPGGSHNGNSIIDPRLAWSEGWANFFQSAVLRQSTPSWSYYVDTSGFLYDAVEGKGTSDVLASVNLAASGSLYPDAVGADGEGTFREMSVSRTLFKTVTTAGIEFSHVWRAFSTKSDNGQTSGFASPSVAFRNIGLFNQYLQYWINQLQPGQQSDWDGVLSNEKQNKDARNYADTLVLNSGCTAYNKTIAPVVDDAHDLSNQFRSNHFYRFDHDGNGTTSILLEYTGGANTSGAKRNLNLHLYKEDYVYQESWESSNGTMVRSSAVAYPADGGDEQISLSGLSAGRYLINVKAYTYDIGSGSLTGDMSYHLKQIKNGTTGYLCPSH
ncbi:MAG TPA: carboxypeptidase-like regulatory domain-containing protein [Pseudobdellovibrionaceae bacterium]|nr:carboxypeptidase-like regulatory domain-containing protein [Pseudobdellovibrionaceae bacterium]